MAGCIAARTELLRELRTARMVTDPNVCRLHDAAECTVDGAPVVFLTMELLHGETLAERLGRRPRLSFEEAKTFATRSAARFPPCMPRAWW